MPNDIISYPFFGNLSRVVAWCGLGLNLMMLCWKCAVGFMISNCVFLACFVGVILFPSVNDDYCYWLLKCSRACCDWSVVDKWNSRHIDLCEQLVFNVDDKQPYLTNDSCYGLCRNCSVFDSILVVGLRRQWCLCLPQNWHCIYL